MENPLIELRKTSQTNGETEVDQIIICLTLEFSIVILT